MRARLHAAYRAVLLLSVCVRVIFPFCAVPGLRCISLSARPIANLVARRFPDEMDAGLIKCFVHAISDPADPPVQNLLRDDALGYGISA